MHYVLFNLLGFRRIRNTSNAKTAKGDPGGRNAGWEPRPGGVPGSPGGFPGRSRRPTDSNVGERITNNLLRKRWPPGRDQGGDGRPFSQPGDP